MLQEQFIKEMQAKLLEAKGRLERELSGLTAHTEMGDDEDENAEELNVDEVSQDLISRINDDLGKINQALAKIEQGTYGLDSQGRQISEERLRALPWADKAI